MNRCGEIGIDRAALVDRVAQHVHDAAQRAFAYRHRDRLVGVVDHVAAAQSVGRAQRDGAHDAVTQLLLHFQRQRRAVHLERVVHLGHLVAREFDVDHRANALNNLALNACVIRLSHLVCSNQLICKSRIRPVIHRHQTAAAPATISESSLVIAACRVLL
jgi:hypothetical protein